MPKQVLAKAVAFAIFGTLGWDVSYAQSAARSLPLPTANTPPATAIQGQAPGSQVHPNFRVQHATVQTAAPAGYGYSQSHGQAAPAQGQQSLKHFPLVEMLKPVPPGMPRRDIDPMELILGPDSRTRARDLGPLQPIERGASCEELYNRVTVLLDQSLRTRPGVFDDPATSLFAALGAIAPPAYLLVGVSAVAKLAEERHTQTVDQRIESLRRRMASKRCFVD